MNHPLTRLQTDLIAVQNALSFWRAACILGLPDRDNMRADLTRACTCLQTTLTEVEAYEDEDPIDVREETRPSSQRSFSFD